MKKYCLFLAAIAVGMAANAQKGNEKANSVQADFECLYEYRVTNLKGDADTYTAILQIGRSYACFKDYTAFQTDSVCQSPHVSKEETDKYRLQEMKNDLYFDQTVYQNYPKGNLSVYSVITPDYYTYTENSRSVAWNLVEETDTICGYMCKKATGVYGGRTWTAWYAPEIPVAFGPWKLCGLPGLVMAANDAENIHRFEAIGFRNGTTLIAAPDFPNVVTVTREKFVRAKNKFEENPMGNLPVEAISEVTIQKDENGKGSVLVNGVRLRMRPNGYIPLEVE